MRAAGVIFEAKKHPPFVFLALVFVTTLSLLFISFQKHIHGDYQPMLGSFQTQVATPMQTTYIPPPTAQTQTPSMTSMPQPAQQQSLQQPIVSRNVVIIRRMIDSPSVLTIPAGTTVIWFNEEDMDIPHTVTSDSNLWDSGILSPGQAFSKTFFTPGTYPYHCRIHPFMHGTIIVVPSPTMSIAPFPTVSPSMFPPPTGFPPGQPMQQQTQGGQGAGNFQTQSQTQTNTQTVNVSVAR